MVITETVLLGVLAAELGDDIEVLAFLLEEHVVRDQLRFRRIPMWLAIQMIEQRDEHARREEEAA
jgi:hypothetical protein